MAQHGRNRRAELQRGIFRTQLVQDGKTHRLNDQTRPQRPQCREPLDQGDIAALIGQKGCRCQPANARPDHCNFHNHFLP